MNKCLECGKSIPETYIFSVEKKRKFCSNKCNSRYHIKINYKKYVKNPEFKRRRKAYFKDWLEKNREHFNDLMREPNRIRSNKIHKYRRKNNLCNYCGKKLKDEKLKVCLKCRGKYYK